MDIVSDLIWTAFPALFEYLDVLYGPVRRFGDGAPMDAWKSQTRNIDGTAVDHQGRATAENFTYTHIQSTKNLLTDEEGPVKELAKLNRFKCPEVKIHKITLTVQVPAHANDSFWTRKSCSWKSSEDRYPITVTKFGYTTQDANWWATSSAIEVIRCIREDGMPKPFIRAPPRDCPALRLGRQLHNLWQSGSDSFKDFSQDTAFWSNAKSKLDAMIAEWTEFELLLKYYKVIIQHYQEPFPEV
jgi:hypothetical protein